MEIRKTNVVDKKALYRLTHSQQAAKMGDLEGQVFRLSEYCYYIETKTSGDGTEKEQEVFATIVDGKVYGTISKTFIQSILDIIEMFENDDDWEVTVSGGDTKGGRHFIYAEVV